MNAILPECILGYLFNIKKEIKIENYQFHKMIYQMKKQDKYRELLDNIRFSGSPINPYSEVLDEALFNLQFSGGLTRKNPEMVWYSISKEFDDIYKNLSENIDKEQEEKLKTLSEEVFEKYAESVRIEI